MRQHALRWSRTSAVFEVVNRVRRRTRNYTPRQFVAWTVGWLYWNSPLHHLGIHRMVQGLSATGSRDVARAADPIHLPVCNSVRKWAEGQTGVTVKPIEPARHVHVTLPHLTDAVMRREITWASQQPLPEQYLAIVPQAQVLGARGLVRLPDGSYPLELSYGDTKLLNEFINGLELDKIPAQFKRGSFYSVSLPYFTNYGHWVMDVAVRSLLALEHLPQDISFIVPKHMLPFQWTTLQVLGINQERCVEIGWRQVWQVEQLYMTPMSSYMGVDRPEANRRLRERFWKACGIKSHRAHRRLYLTRRGMSNRRIVNEAELELELASYGFETIAPETLSLLDQVKLFSEAEIVIGAHGAALTNLVFAPDGTRLLDICDKTYAEAFFWTLCPAFGHNYQYLLAETVPNAGGKVGQDTDMYVSLDQFKAALQPLVSRVPDDISHRLH